MNLHPRHFDLGDWLCLACGCVVAFFIAVATGLI